MYNFSQIIYTQADNAKSTSQSIVEFDLHSLVASVLVAWSRISPTVTTLPLATTPPAAASETSDAGVVRSC